MKTFKWTTRDGLLAVDPLARKVKKFTAKGEIMTISDDFKRFGLFCMSESVRGVHVPKNGVTLEIRVGYEARVMLRSWIKVGDIISVALLYKIYYLKPDEQTSRIHFLHFNNLK